MYQKRNFPQPFKTKLPSSRLTVHRQLSYQLHSFLVCQLKAHFAHHSRKKSHVNLWSFEKYEMLSSKTLYNNYFKKQYNIKEGFFIWRKIKNSKIYIYIQNQEGSHVIFIGLHRNVGTYFMIWGWVKREGNKSYLNDSN